MSQYDFGTIVPTSKNGTALATDLMSWRTALHSSHKGPTAPPYAIAGLRWLDDAADPLWLYKIYDGTSWITLFAIDSTNNIAWTVNSGEKQNYPLAGGSANALTLTPTVAMTAYADLDVATFEASSNNTSAVTLNISGVGAKAIRKVVAGADVALVAGDILDGCRYILNYDSAANAAAGAWIIVNPSLVLKQSSAPAPTVEGDLWWDTDDDVIVVGDGAGQKIFLAIPAGTAAGDIEYFSAAKVKARLAKGTAGQRLAMNSGASAPTWEDNVGLSTSQATTSGTAFDFTGIPATAKRILVAFVGVSISGNDQILVQIGSGSVTTTGYVSSGGYAASGPSVVANTSTAGFVVNPNGTSQNLVGFLEMVMADAATNTWAASHGMGGSTGGILFVGGGYVSLAGAIDRVRITRSGTNTFDAGKINVMWS